MILAGGMAEHLRAFGDVGERAGEVVLGPAALRGSPGGPLADLLTELALPADDARRALGAGAVALAEVLDRRVDVVEIGFDAGTRAAGAPGIAGGVPTLDMAVVPTAALAPSEPDDSVIDRVGLWSTWGADRHRLRDRMRELRIAPWADATGDGATLRMAAARAALGRLAEWTPEWADRPAADLVVATGGAWAVARRADRRARPRRRAAPAGCRPVRPGPRSAPGAARIHPGSRRAPGDDLRPGR